MQCPDGQYQFLYDAAIRSVLLHSPGDVYPGPYTYKRFWFRDAAFILDSLLCAGFASRVKRCIDTFPRRQGPTGYFLSQEGEWDANGEADLALTPREEQLNSWGVLHGGVTMTLLDVAMARFQHQESLLQALAEARNQLNDRKLIDRAKGLLMKRHDIGEPEAYARLRKTAMDKGLKIADVAQRVVDVAELLG